MKPRMRIAAAVIAVGGLVAAGGGVALASSGRQAATTQATTTVHVGTATSTQVTWHSLHLINGWKAMSAKYYGAPSYAIQNGVLYLSGILAAPRSVTGPEFAVLPAGARPKHFLWLLYYNFGGSGTGMVGNMEIQPDGDMFIYGPGSGPILDPTLQAISFPVSS
jgi:hypothetical protein